MKLWKVSAIALLALLSAIAVVNAIDSAEEIFRNSVAQQQAL